MISTQTKTIFFSVLLTGLLIPFSGINSVDAESEINKTLSEEECFDQITESIATQENNLVLDILKNQATAHTDFQTLQGDSVSEFKNTIQYWTPDTKNCSVALKQIDVKYNLDKDTDSHKELIVSINGETKQILKSELADPSKRTHTNTSTEYKNWAGITQMEGSTKSSSDPTKVRAFFDVPTANDPSSFNCGTTSTTHCVVSVWAGLTENDDGNDTMIQSGTDSTCNGNNCGTSRVYTAWLEKVDNDGSDSQDVCTSLTVSAGDSVRAYTYYYDSTNKYSAGVYNYDERAICSISYTSEVEDAHYGQFIVERPSNGNTILPLASFSDFDMKGEIMINGSYEGLGDYSTIGDSWKIDMKDTTSVTNISASWPASNDKITFDYLTSSGTNDD